MKDSIAARRDSASEETDKPTVDTYDEAVTAYNDAFTIMNDNGLTLLRERERSADLIDLITVLINSIANSPKSFKTDFDEIKINKENFISEEEFARKNLESARDSAGVAGAGATAGAAVASLAPSAAMWVATTFGTASTGTAISTLSGAAASKAALAWLGGGALTAGGSGMAGGSALLALAGPIGWTIAGATLLTSVVLFTRRGIKNRDAKHKELISIKENTTQLAELNAQISDILARTDSLRELLQKRFAESMALHGVDFLALSEENQTQLATLVNNTKACAAQLNQKVEESSNGD